MAEYCWALRRYYQTEAQRPNEDFNTLVRLWDYCWEYAAAIRSLTASRHINLDDVTPFEKVYSYTPNISEYLTHSWYEWVWYHSPTFFDKCELGRWLKPAHNCGQGLVYHVLAESGKVVTRSIVHSLSVADNASPECIQRNWENWSNN